jgi:hypothetical protein
LEAAAKAGSDGIPSYHLNPPPEDLRLRKDVDLKYKKVLYQCKQEAQVLETSSDDDLPANITCQIGTETPVLELLDATVNIRPSDITDKEYFEMLKRHDKRRKAKEIHPELNTSTTMLPDFSGHMPSMKKKTAAGRHAESSTARVAPQHKVRVVRQTKAMKRAPANRQTSQKNTMQASSVQSSKLQCPSAAVDHADVVLQLRESALSRPAVYVNSFVFAFHVYLCMYFCGCFSHTDYVVKPSSEEEKMKFRQQEWMRYQEPHRAFTYRMHGFDSVVGPVKGAYDKDNVPSKARDHFLLLKDRPPVITILTLVRDAAARMPNGEGTRAEICVLLKDSQFLSPTCTDQQIHQVVSGALDRLHYEKDPCVRYDSSRKVWLYLHYGRTEEEFERLHMAEGAAAKSRKRAPGARQGQKQTKATKKQAMQGITYAAPPHPPSSVDIQPPFISVSESPSPWTAEPQIEPEFMTEDSSSQPHYLPLPALNPQEESASTPEIDTSFGGEQGDESGSSSGSSGSVSSSEGSSSSSESEDNEGSVSSSSASSSARVIATGLPGGAPVPAADADSEGSSSP